MAFGDRRGPNGAGPMTGRGAGFCAGYDRPGYVNPAGGRFARGGAGYGYGRGNRNGRMGYGFRGYNNYPNYVPTPISKDDEKIYLKNEVDLIEKELDSAKKRLADLEKSEKSEK